MGLCVGYVEACCVDTRALWVHPSMHGPIRRPALGVSIGLSIRLQIGYPEPKGLPVEYRLVYRQPETAEAWRGPKKAHITFGRD